MFVVSQKPKKKSKFIIRTEASRIINPPQNIILNPQISKISTLNNQINKNIITQKNQGIIKKIFPKKPMFRLTFVRPSHNQNKHKIKNETKNNSMNNKIKTRRNNLSNIKYSCGRWKEDEHKRFIEAIIKYGNDWKQVQKYVKTRSSTQARSHAQKFFVKIKKSKVLDFNLDLSKTSIKMFHDMIKEAPVDKYNKILNALNSVAFERGNNKKKKVIENNNNNLNNNIKNSNNSNIDKKSSNEIVYNIPNEEFLMPNKINENNYNDVSEVDNGNLIDKDNDITNDSKIIDRFEKVKNLKISKDEQNISVNFIDNKLNKNIDTKSNEEKNIFEEFERNNFNKENENNNNNNNMNITQNLMDSKSISYMKTNTNNNYNNNNSNNNNNFKNNNNYSNENINNNNYNITDDDILNDELEEDNCNYRIGNSSDISDNNINTEKEEIKKEESEEEENYENDFEIDKATLKNILEGEKTQDNNVNLDDYKEIHESQQLQSQLNFFESNNNIENINIKKSKHQKISPKNDINFKNSLMISNSISDSYGDNIINDLNKFRRLALEESSISNYYKK